MYLLSAVQDLQVLFQQGSAMIAARLLAVSWSAGVANNVSNMSIGLARPSVFFLVVGRSLSSSCLCTSSVASFPLPTAASEWKTRNGVSTENTRKIR